MNYVTSFIFGILAAAGALVIELILSASLFILFGIDTDSSYSNRITLFLFIVALLEEFLKFIFLLKLIHSQKKPILLGAYILLFGIGFTSLEISTKLLSLPDIIFSSLFDIKILGIILIHLLTTGIMGNLIYKKSISSFYQGLPIIFLASFIHIIYNLLLIYGT